MHSNKSRRYSFASTCYTIKLVVHPDCATSDFMFRAIATPIILHPNGWSKLGYTFEVEGPELRRRAGAAVPTSEQPRSVDKRCNKTKQIHIQLTPQHAMDTLFPSFESKRLSVCNMVTREIYINESRWRREYADDKSEMTLPAYRCYVLNHEIGHALGRMHERCSGTGKRAPIMLQQTVGLHGCLPDPFPQN